MIQQMMLVTGEGKQKVYTNEDTKKLPWHSNYIFTFPGKSSRQQACT